MSVVGLVGLVVVVVVVDWRRVETVRTLALVCVAGGRWSPRSIVIERQTSLTVVAGGLMLAAAHKTARPAIATVRVLHESRDLGINSHALARVSVALAPAHSQSAAVTYLRRGKNIEIYSCRYYCA